MRLQEHLNRWEAYWHAHSAPMVSHLLSTLKQNQLLHTVQEGAGRRSQILALSELINLCEGRKVF